MASHSLLKPTVNVTTKQSSQVRTLSRQATHRRQSSLCAFTKPIRQIKVSIQALIHWQAVTIGGKTNLKGQWVVPVAFVPNALKLSQGQGRNTMALYKSLDWGRTPGQSRDGGGHNLSFSIHTQWDSYRAAIPGMNARLRILSDKDRRPALVAHAFYPKYLGSRGSESL